MKILGYIILIFFVICTIGYCVMKNQLSQTTWGGWTPDEEEVLEEGYISSEQIVKEKNTSTFENKTCEESSEWRDHNGPDNCSFYPDNVSCSKIQGKLDMISRLHKGALEKNVFEGGVSSRWFEIKNHSIVYFNPTGEIADKGKCKCNNGILKIDWEKGTNLPDESRIYFRSEDSIELRYYDYPFDFKTLKYDSLKPKTNPTKILGVIR